jgi:small neutral amino acid transporter SnatA (MarC family)
MIDYLVCLSGMSAAVAPFGALAAVIAYRQSRTDQPEPDVLLQQQLTYFAPAAALAVLILAALISSPLLDAFDISGSSFEFAAAATMVPLAIRLLVAGDSMAVPRWNLPAYAWLVPFSVPLLAGPVSIIAAVSYADRIGLIETIVMSAVALAVTAGLFATLPWWERQRLLVVQMLGRVSGALLAGMAVEMALDGLGRI